MNALTMTAKRSASLLLAASLFVSLTACGGDEPPAEIDLDSSPAPSASAGTEQEQAVPAEDEIPLEPVAGSFIRGLNPAKTADEKEVAEQWFRYRAELNRMYREVDVDRALLSELATDLGFSGPAGYVERMSRAGNHNEGGTIGTIQTIAVDGDGAKVQSCLRSTLAEVTAQGVPIEAAPGFLRTQETFERTAGTWKVTRFDVLESGVPCEHR